MAGEDCADILKSTAYRSGGVLFIVWDEANKGDRPIPMIVLSPYAKGNGYSNDLHYTDGSTLRTLLQLFSVDHSFERRVGARPAGMFTAFP